MKRREGAIRNLHFRIGLLLSVCALSGVAVAAPGATLVQRESYTFEAPILSVSEGVVAVTVAGCEPYGVPGRPWLPVRGVVLPAPPGYKSGRVTVLPGEPLALDLVAPLAHAPEPIPLDGVPTMLPRRARDESVYGRRAVYPAYGSDEGGHWRSDRRRGQTEVTVPLYPVRLAPAENRLLFYSEITVEVVWELEAEVAAADTVSPLPLAGYARGALSGTDASPLESGRYTHVIITTQALASAGAPWGLSALVAARVASGVSSRIVTVDWIYENYEGRDAPEQIRNFLRDAHQTWQTRYALLVGNVQRVPTRQLYSKFSSNTAMIAADGIYYGCLDGDFDSNGNNVFGEIGDGPEGGDVDLAAEIYVGRFPVTTVKELQYMVRKTLLYESLLPQQFGRIGYIGEYLGFGGASEYADGALLAIRNGSEQSGYNTLGFENPTYGDTFANTVTFNDSPTNTWTKYEMLKLFNQDVHVFNHLGHGARLYCFKLNFNTFFEEQQILGLTNRVPYFAYSQACDSGWYDGASRCFAERFVTVSNAAFAAVMNSRSGWGYQGNIDGPSQRFHRMFWDVIFRGEAATLGEANALAKERLRHLVDPASGDVMRWCYYTINLFGDPATPFAARTLRHKPQFGHEALINSFVTNAAHDIVVELGPYGLIEQSSPKLLWFTGDAPEVIHTNILAHNTPEEFVVTIPAQPLGTSISYALLADTIAGVAGRWPESGWHSFAITPPLTLTVGGAPQPWGNVTPAYGVSMIASGVVVRATAAARVLEGGGVSRALVGATFNGQSVSVVPLAETEFALLEPSELVWQWQTEHALQYTSNIPKFLQQTVWLTPTSMAELPLAPTTRVYANKTHVFSGWYLDGQRQPTAPSVILSQVSGIDMTTPHNAFALYIPITQDSDGNGLPDWWEYHYFGRSGLDPDEDVDGDGFTLAQEYADRTNPLDKESYPQAPLIQHVPLAAVQYQPPPYVVEATITDSYQVAVAQMLWRLNDAPWQTNTMALVAAESNLYRTTLVANARPGDTFTYKLLARDPAGYEAVHGPHTVALDYPQAAVTPTASLSVVSSGDVEVTLSLTNSGTSTLVWQLAAGVAEPVGPQPGLWETNAFEQPWSISTSRFASAPFSFHGRARSAGGYYSPPVHAGLRSPTFRPAPDAALFFRYWIAGEVDKSNAGRAFDGGIVMVSTNNGVDFVQLAGSYTHLLTGWTYSPWENDTPCFSGDGSEGWRDAIFPLDQFAGQEVCFMFVYGGDNNTDGEGWYIDDIRLGPTLPLQWPPWLVCGASAGALVPGRGLEIPLYLMSSKLEGRQGQASLHLLSNDPAASNICIDVTLKLRDPPLLLGVSGAQTSTNGEGVVSINAEVAERDGEPLTIEVEYSYDGGVSWQMPQPLSGAAQFGQVQVSTNGARLSGVATMLTDGQIVTNMAALRWDSRAVSPPLLPLMTGMLARARVWSPYFAAAEAVVSAPFMIDNEPPTAPGGVKSLSHYPRFWSSLNTFNGSWQAASDGHGIGGITYRWDLWPEGAGTLVNLPRQSAASAAIATFSGSNVWFAVQALDAYGNTSAVVRVGPYFMDITPPQTDGAYLTVQRSAFGDYIVGSEIKLTWGGFSDAHSGILGYGMMAVAGEQTGVPLFVGGVSNTLEAAAVGSVNTVLLYAIDWAGNMSAVLPHEVLVLDPDDDIDQDGHTAAEEELAGTDATDRHSVLRLGLAGVREVEGGLELRVVWHGVAGRRYTVQGTPSLTVPLWNALPGLTDIPGNNATVTNTVVRGETTLFLRLKVATEN